jgi:Arc/MetJ-type ribon-helix-helix transcriptional regulator
MGNSDIVKMMDEEPPATHVTIKLPKELVAEMDKLQGKHGFRSRGEIAKEAIRQFLTKYEEDLKPLPRFEQLNFDDNGVKILDRKLGRVADVFFKRTGIYCNLDETDDCEHIQFALKERDIQRLIRKKKAEGWKLPDV